MKKPNQKHRHWSWWLLGTLIALALVLGTWGIMRPCNDKEEATLPRATKIQQSKEQRKKTEKTTKAADKAERATAPATATTSGPSTSTTADPGGPVANDRPETTTGPDNSVYDSPYDAAAGTAIGAELNNLVAELNKLTSQYTEFQDVTAFNNGLASVQARNNQLLARATTNADRNLATKINGAITHMQTDPANAQSIANHIWH